MTVLFRPCGRSPVLRKSQRVMAIAVLGLIGSLALIVVLAVMARP